MLKNENYSKCTHISHEQKEVLLKCFNICNSCAKLCIKENLNETAALCLECADICALTIKWQNANSVFTKKISELCAEVCLCCAEACACNNNKYCQQCCEICHECAKTCKNQEELCLSH